MNRILDLVEVIGFVVVGGVVGLFLAGVIAQLSGTALVTESGLGGGMVMLALGGLVGAVAGGVRGVSLVVRKRV